MEARGVLFWISTVFFIYVVVLGFFFSESLISGLNWKVDYSSISDNGGQQAKLKAKINKDDPTNRNFRIHTITPRRRNIEDAFGDLITGSTLTSSRRHIEDAFGDQFAGQRMREKTVEYAKTPRRPKIEDAFGDPVTGTTLTPSRRHIEDAFGNQADDDWSRTTDNTIVTVQQNKVEV